MRTFKNKLVIIWSNARNNDIGIAFRTTANKERIFLSDGKLSRRFRINTLLNKNLSKAEILLLNDSNFVILIRLNQGESVQPANESNTNNSTVEEVERLVTIEKDFPVAYRGAGPYDDQEMDAIVEFFGGDSYDAAAAG